MGACVSFHKDPESAMKFRLTVGSKNEENLGVPSPIKDKPTVNGHYRVADGGLNSQRSTSQLPSTVRDIGSKEETFFDSQPWLDSDCDDDFFSVNGDFTPSRGSTPVHHSFSAGPPRLGKAYFDSKTSGSTPPESPKKRLSELFRESFQSNSEADEQDIIGNQNGMNVKTEAKGLPQRSANSGNTERTPTIGDYVIKKEEPLGSMRCCFPRVLSSRGFSERKTPPRSVG